MQIVSSRTVSTVTLSWSSRFSVGLVALTRCTPSRGGERLLLLSGEWRTCSGDALLHVAVAVSGSDMYSCSYFLSAAIESKRVGVFVLHFIYSLFFCNLWRDFTFSDSWNCQKRPFLESILPTFLLTIACQSMIRSQNTPNKKPQRIILPSKHREENITGCDWSEIPRGIQSDNCLT